MSRTSASISFFFSTRVTNFILLASLYCLTSLPVHAVETSERLLARFKMEALSAWKLNESADESPATIKVITKISHYSNGQLTKTEEKSALLHRKFGSYLFEPLQSRGGGRHIFGKNLRYSYLLIKEDSKDDCTLDKLRLEGRKGFGEIPIDLFQYIKPNSYAFIPTLGSLSNLVSSASFKALSAEEVENQFVRVHFRTIVNLASKKMEVTGWMDFDPNNAWALQSCQYETSLESTSKFVKHFSSSQHAGFRACESWESIQGVTNKNDWEMRENAQFEILNSSPPADEIFTLSHFGLPEPMGVPPTVKSHTWLWLLTAALVAAILAILFAWLRRRRTLASQVKTQVVSR